MSDETRVDALSDPAVARLFAAIDQADAALEAIHSALPAVLALIPAPHPQGAGDVVAEMDAEITAAALETRHRLVVAASDRFLAERDAARIEIQRLEGVLESTRADRDMFALLAAAPAPTEGGAHLAERAQRDAINDAIAEADQ